MAPYFQNRAEAGRALAESLSAYRGDPSLLVLGLPRGGVPVAYEVAKSLQAPLDVLVVRKLGAPTQPELAMGAIASGGVRVLNYDVIRTLGISPSDIEFVAQREAIELKRREQVYRGDLPPQDLSGRTIILVDDGLATGATMRVAAEAVKLRKPRRVIIAIPVGSIDTCDELSQDVDDLICPWPLENFHAVGIYYRDFSPTSDQEVYRLLAMAVADNAANPLESKKIKRRKTS